MFSIIFIAGCNHFITWLQSLQYFVIIRVLTAKLYIYFIGCFSIITYFKDPVATGLLIETTLWQQVPPAFHHSMQAVSVRFVHGEYPVVLHLQIPYQPGSGHW